MTTYPTHEQATEMAENTELPFFVYGTLRPGEGNDWLWRGIARQRFNGKCKVHDFRLVSNGSFPYALPAEGEESFGCLIVPFAEHYDEVRDRFDSLESRGVHYDRVMVAVLTTEGYISSWMYVPCDPSQYEDYVQVEANDWARRHRQNVELGWTS